MKYFRIFIAVLFFFISAAIPVLYQSRLPNNVIHSTSSSFIFTILFYFPFIISVILSIVFLVYLLRFSGNGNLYWSIFFLVFAVNLFITLLIDIPARVIGHIEWMNFPNRDKELDFLYKLTLARGVGWFFTFIAIVGFICLFLYFRSKHKSKITANKLA